MNIRFIQLNFLGGKQYQIPTTEDKVLPLLYIVYDNKLFKYDRIVRDYAMFVEVSASSVLFNPEVFW